MTIGIVMSETIRNIGAAIIVCAVGRLTINPKIIAVTQWTFVIVGALFFPADCLAQFVDVTASVGLNAYSPAGNDLSAAWGDYNKDGMIDLWLGTYDVNEGGLFQNSGGSFTKINGAGVANLPGVFVDYNNDGYPDIATALAGGHIAKNNGNGTFTAQGGVFDAHSAQSESATWADFNNDGYLDSYRTGWEMPDFTPYPDAIFMSNAGNHFDKTWEGPTGNEQQGRGVTSADFDEDGDMDIYVSNYRLSNNFLWQNDGTGNFTDVANTYGVDADNNPTSGSLPGGHTIGSSWGDIDNDGHLDLVVGNFAHSSANQDRPQFYRNMGPGGGWQFEDKTASVGLPYVQSHASPTLVDYDNDGDLDMFISAISGPSYPAGNEKAKLMRNDGNWNFTDVSTSMGLNFTTTQSNFTAAWGDYDNDGDLDLLTDRKLFENTQTSSNNWLQLRLEGDGVTVNRDAIGAQVRIDLGGGVILTRQVENATGWGNQNDPRLHFGLGSNATPVSVEISWPNGTTQTINNVSVDQMINVVMTGPTFEAYEREDIEVYHGSTGEWSGSHTDPAPTFLTGTTTTQTSGFGTALTKPLIGDVNGDGLDDIVRVDPAGNYNWTAGHTTDSNNDGVGELAGGLGDSMLVGFGTVASSEGNFLADINGDGFDDAVTINAGFNWFNNSSSSAGLGAGPTSGPVQFGLAGDQPITGDFDGDGFEDIGVYRPVGGNIFWNSSAGGVLGAGGQGPIGQIGGNVGQDTLLIGDLNADGFDDAVMVRQDGVGLMEWFGLINDGTGFLDFFNSGTTLVSFGQDNGSDTPILADVNGDGLVDIGYVRDTGGQLVWEFAFTTAGGGLSNSIATSAIFGVTGDIPLIGQFNILPADADFDADGDVDGSDFLAWQRGFGITSGATPAQGDANGDFAVDADDLATWQTTYGYLDNSALVGQQIPEPTGILLFLLGIALLRLITLRN